MIAAYLPMIDLAHPLSGCFAGEGSSEEDERPQEAEAAGFGFSPDDSGRDRADPQRSWSPSDLLAPGAGMPVALAENAETQNNVVADGSVPAVTEQVRRSVLCLSRPASGLLSFWSRAVARQRLRVNVASA